VTGPDAGENGAAPAAPVEAKPIKAVALAREVVLERMQNLLEWLLCRLKRYRAARGEWSDR